MLMKYRHSLRFRIVFSYFMASSLIGAVFSAFLYVGISQLEEQLIFVHIKDELNYFIKLTDRDSTTTRQTTQTYSAYRLKPGEPVPGFSDLEKRAPGLHEIELNEREDFIHIIEQNGYRYYIIYDATAYEHKEHLLMALLAGAILLMILLGVWAAYLFSAKLIAPVTRLANEVDEITGKVGEHNLASSYASDEVGKLAQAFDRYAGRITQFLRRERHFTADASHELRTPLTVIQGAVEVLQQNSQLDEKSLRRLDRIERAAHDMGQNLEVLLLLARETEQGDISDEDTDIAAILERLVTHYREQIKQDAIVLHVDIQSHPCLFVPSAAVRIILNNLISNAIKYTTAGRIDVILTDSTIEVIDTGCGISENELQHVFERGFRGKETNGYGSGLGLSIVRRICDHFGWQMSIDSAEGEGTLVRWVFSTDKQMQG